MSILKQIAPFALLVAMAVPAVAYDVPVAFEQFAADSAQARSMWGDKLAEAGPFAKEGTAVLSKTIDGKEGRFVVSMYVDDFFCGDQICPLRVFQGDKLVFDRATCRVTDQVVLRPDARKVVACGEVYDLQPN